MNAFEELLALLAKSKIKFITVGGFACAFNGYTRATEDIDILVKADRINLENLLAVLSNYNEGFAAELEVEDFTDEEGSIRIIEIFPIDIFVKMSGYHYDDFLNDIKYLNLNGYEIPYLAKSKLILLKQDSLRETDQLDVMKLKSLPS